MNLERTKALADFIESKNLPINMKNIFTHDAVGNSILFARNNEPTCGTAACIMGWTLFHMKDQGEKLPVHRASDLLAGEYLGLSPREIDALFYPFDYQRPHHDAQSKALDVLRGNTELTPYWLVN